MKTYEKYITEANYKGLDKEVINLSKKFIADMRIIFGKYDFQSVDDVFGNFLKAHIDELTKIYKRIK